MAKKIGTKKPAGGDLMKYAEKMRAQAAAERQAQREHEITLKQADLELAKIKVKHEVVRSQAAEKRYEIQKKTQAQKKRQATLASKKKPVAKKPATRRTTSRRKTS